MPWKQYLSPRTARALALVVLIGLVVLLELPLPHLPGMIPEGIILDQLTSIHLMEIIERGEFMEHFFAGKLPSARDVYHCPVMAYLFLPFLYIWGPDWMLVRYWPLLFAIFTLLFTFWFVEENFGSSAGFLTLGLLAVHPSYVIGLRLGNHLWFPMQFFSMGALFCLSRWWHTRRTSFLGAGMFLLGVGLSTQLWFAWFAVGLLLMGLVFHRALAQRLRGRWTKQASIAAACLLFGSALLLYRDVTHGFGSVRVLLDGLSSKMQNQFGYFDSLPRVLEVFENILRGQLLFDWLFRSDPASSLSAAVMPPRNSLYPLLFWASALVLVHAAAKKGSKRALFVTGLFLAMLFQAPLSPRGLADQHLFFFYPFPQIVIAVAVVRSLGGRARLIGAVALLSLIVTKEILCLETYYWQLKATGGTRAFSQAVYDMADWLASGRARARPLVFINDVPSIVPNLLFILPNSGLKYAALHIDGPETAAAAGEQAARMGPEVLVIRNIQSEEKYPSGFQYLLSWALRNRCSVSRLKRFVDVDGALLWEVHALRFGVPPRVRERHSALSSPLPPTTT